MADNCSRRGFSPATWKTSPRLWSNFQWAVTTFGLENVTGGYHYFITRDDVRPALRDFWLAHLHEKSWVDDAYFAEAYDRAVRILPSAPPYEADDADTEVEDE